MQARANELEGRFILESQPGQGTSVTLQLPL
jgi:signal transduction histidine kinase